MSDLRYPIGPFTPDPVVTAASRLDCIRRIAEAPANLRAAVDGWSDDRLEMPYRPEGWTVRQVVHHVPDSHMNAYVRFRLALTEHNPTIRPYEEAEWAKLVDARSAPVELSLSLLEAVHRRWVLVLEDMKDEDFARPLVHPQHGQVNLDWMLQLYAWHGRHHTAHITSLAERMGWTNGG